LEVQMPDWGKTEELKDRTKRFALRIIALYRALTGKPEAQIIGTQVLRSGTSVGANYRAACRARSRREFIAKDGRCRRRDGRDRVLA
jgi:four helix bundle protein